MKEYKISINGNVYNVAINDVDDSVAKVSVNGVNYEAKVEGLAQRPKASKVVKPAVAASNAPAPAVVKASRPAAAATGGAIKSPLPGTILDVSVAVGTKVTAGQKVMLLEAMKMENIIEADKDGEVTSISVGKGDSVLEGDVLLTIG